MKGEEITKINQTSQTHFTIATTTTSTTGYLNADCLNKFSVVIVLISVATILFLGAQECRLCLHEKFKASNSSTRVSNPDKFGRNHEQKYVWIHVEKYQQLGTDYGFLHNIVHVLQKFGYSVIINNTDDGTNALSNRNWHLLWAHDYPFTKLQNVLKYLKAHQRVNHFPGCGFLTNKVELATTAIKYVPPAFRLPQDRDRLEIYANQYPNKLFVQKNNDHRHIQIRNIKDIDYDTASETFIQEFVEKPLLVDGYKFDIGIYVVITSIEPLRVYAYNGDVLLRFCPIKYYPFDPNILDKYVVGDDYLPIWNVPSLGHYYNHLGFGMRESLNAHLRSVGQDPNKIWSQIQESIRLIILNKEAQMADIVHKYTNEGNFFEIMRFDFVADDELNVYLLEANMSPNLSSAHFPPNQLLYQQVLYNIMSLLGLGSHLRTNNINRLDEMQVSYKNIATYPNECNSKLCQSGCSSPKCQLCRDCLTPEMENKLKQAFREYTHRGDCKRIFPPVPLSEDVMNHIEDYSPENQMIMRWFYGKCILDKSWC